MPWSNVSPTNEKIAFMGDYIEGYFNFSELCERFLISRQAGYELVEKYFTIGPDCVKPQSRKPHSCPHRTSSDIEEALITIRKKHPFWGAKKLADIFQRSNPKLSPPARSTICDILKRNELITKRRRRPPLAHPGKPMTVPRHPNDIWAVDYKGEFKTKNGIYCYPLTVTDGFSRYILSCKGLLVPRFPETKKVFTRLFRTYGLPNQIRSDNGAPFASVTLGRLSRLSIWWIRLGIFPELIEPGMPQQNGKHERMHKTLKAETICPPAQDLKKQQYRFDTFVKEFNNERPHEGLDMKFPSEVYHASKREMPEKLPPMEYPGNFHVRRVSKNGGVRWKHNWIRVTQTLGEEYVGMEEIDTGIYEVYFGPVYLGRFYEKQMQIIPRKKDDTTD